MAWENYVGRVGGLAVALGIGSAIAAVPTVAWADSDDTPSVSASAGPTKASADKPDRAVKKTDGKADKPTAKRGLSPNRATKDADAEASKPVVSSADNASEAQAPAKGRLFTPLFTPRPAAGQDNRDDGSEPAAAPLLLTMLAT